MKLLTYFVVYYCLFSFKIDFLPLADSSVRIDDFLLVVFILVFLITEPRICFPKPLRTLAYFFLVSILSIIFNISRSGINPIEALLFSIRHIEYAVFFYVGLLLYKYNFNWGRFLGLYLFFSLFVGFLIYYQIIPNPSRFHYDRISANTTGPFEFALLMSFIFYYFLERGKVFHYYLALSGLLLTLSRITIISVCFVLPFINKNNENDLGMKRLFATLLVVGFLLIIYTFGDAWSFVNRFSNLFTQENLASLTRQIQGFVTVENQRDYFDLVYNDSVNTLISNQSGDTSMLIRFNKWVVLLVSTFSISPFLGMGPSFASVGVDGYFIRVFAETGIVGLLLYLKLIFDLFSFAKTTDSNLLTRYLVTLVLTAIFIDIFVAFKPMMLLWLGYGYFYALLKDSHSELNISNSNNSHYAPRISKFR